MTQTPPVVLLPTRRSWRYWKGPAPHPDGEQVANAFEDFMDLTPASQTPAETTRANWDALLPKVAPTEVYRGTDD